MILKRSYQLLPLMMSIILLVMSFFIPLNKVSAEVITHEKYQMDWAYSPQYGKDVRTELLKNASGQIAYCLVYELKSPSGQDLPEAGKTNDVVYRVLLNGYPQKSPEELGVSTWQQAHYSTQLALWNALGQINTAELQFKDAAVEKATKAIINSADQSQETQDVSMNVVPTDKQEAKLNGEYFETTTYAVQTNAKKGTFKVKMNNAPQGTRIVTEQGETKETFQLGEKFRIQVPKSSKSSELSLKVVSNLVNYNAIAYKGTETIQDATVLLERSTEQISTGLQVYWQANGGLKVMKIDENKKPLPGAVFSVLNSGQEVMGTITANENGVAELGNLELGTYTVKEVKAPTGYVLDATPKTFEVKTREVAVVEMKNVQIKGNVQLLKVDQEGKKKLEGAVFTLVDAKGNLISEHTTDKNGVIKVENLPFGQYKFIEKTAPSGYILVKEQIPFNIKENGKTIELIAKNTQAKGAIEITKVDISDGNNKLPGAEFTIYDEQGALVVKGKTNEQGIAKFDKLSAGKYTYKETIAPNGYLINEETFHFEIKNDGDIIKHTVQDKKKEVPPTPETPQPEKPDQPQKPETPENPQLPQVIEKPLPTPKQPLQIIKQPEQPKEQSKKVEGKLPTTGGKAENPYWKWIGATSLVLGGILAFYVFRKRKEAKEEI
ncbi:thioester domain-containing protein [Bacillus pseudomycoides]|uniref:thioester domain-containing protein n=1 Tax=Bacillus pseudomycoides TaxID=64104 RepID=UPI000BFC9E3D|nr:thioester domain-containing protein [Bacillus pseudomycoides]PGE04280.1 adhesin [Bacillus pseudomycoides]PHG20751.1 adhesin [Bacillus pseudomycoides]